MSVKIKNLTVKNFMSIGNVTQSVNFERNDLTLVIGENLDIGGDDNGHKNGVGKSSLLNALTYALYGQALTNIKKDNLINKNNGKNMLVTLTFEKDGVNYKIERGRKPNVLSFYKNDVQQEIADNDAQGDSRETQSEIDSILGMTHDMYKHLVALNTYTEPFLAMPAKEQRTIIEKLLGITVLSEKAEKLKEEIKKTKERIVEEDYKIKGITEANKRINDQIQSLRIKENTWDKTKDHDLEHILSSIETLSKFEIDDEIKKHQDLKVFLESENAFNELSNIANRSMSDIEKTKKLLAKLENELVILENKKCYACGQDIHDHKHNDLFESKMSTKITYEKEIVTYEKELSEILPVIEELSISMESGRPDTFYKTLEEAYNHKMNLDKLVSQYEKRSEQHNPYSEQILSMEQQSIIEVSYKELNELNLLKEHQEFLLKLLVNKDSFIRKMIIDQNLNYLNTRLEDYLSNLGLPHQVKFLNDLNVEISILGKDYDFDNLSRGERTRLILGLCFAFRDVWESLYHPINALFIDELVDNGLDSSGVENALKILKKKARDHVKSIWLISHKDELTSRVDNILKVVKENSFTTFSEES